MAVGGGGILDSESLILYLDQQVRKSKQASARLASKHGSKQGLDWLQSKQPTKC